MDGESFRWRVRSRPTYDQAVFEGSMTVAIELASPPGCPLVVDLPRSHPGNWLGDSSPPVTPAEVAALVRQGLRAGWQPTESGSAFKLQGEVT